jgi:putative tricarboxylic transport membrane protein
MDADDVKSSAFVRGLLPLPPVMKIGELLIGLGVAALGVFIAVETSQITVAPLYAKVGPGVIPYLVAGGLILLGLLFAGNAVWRRAPLSHATATAPPSEGKSDWRPLVVMSVGLVAQMLLIERAGFVIASAVLFACVAYGFGSRRYLRDGIIAVLLAIVVYVGFTRGLSLPLPAGILEGIL